MSYFLHSKKYGKTRFKKKLSPDKILFKYKNYVCCKRQWCLSNSVNSYSLNNRMCFEDRSQWLQRFDGNQRRRQQLLHFRLEDNSVAHFRFRLHHQRQKSRFRLSWATIVQVSLTSYVWLQGLSWSKQHWRTCTSFEACSS